MEIYLDRAKKMQYYINKSLKIRVYNINDFCFVVLSKCIFNNNYSYEYKGGRVRWRIINSFIIH